MTTTLPRLEQAAETAHAEPTVDHRRVVRRNVLIFVFFLACYATFIPQIVSSLNPVTGDEPHYIITALTLAHQHTLDETQSYAQRIYDSFYVQPNPRPPGWQGWPPLATPLLPHATQSTRPGVYSKHGLGVALLIMVPYLIGGRIAVVVLLNVIGALVGLNIFLLARRYCPDWRWAFAIAAALALSSPLMSYAYLIFPEMFAGLLLVYVSRRAIEGRNAPWQWLLIGLASSALPWLHPRFVLVDVGLALGLFPALRREHAWGNRLAVAIPPAVSALVLASFYYALYGRPLPNAADHGGFNFSADTINGFFGLFLDEQSGLLIYAPVYLVALLGLATFWRAYRADALKLAAVALPYLLLLASYTEWWSGWAPPARYLASIAPLAAAPLAAWLGSARRRWLTLVFFAAALCGGVIMGGFLFSPKLMYGLPTGHSELFTSWSSQLFGAAGPKVLPSFQSVTPSPVMIRGAWALLLLWTLLLPWFVPVTTQPLETGDRTARATGQRG